jgi:hypothetical protein
MRIYIKKSCINIISKTKTPDFDEIVNLPRRLGPPPFDDRDLRPMAETAPATALNIDEIPFSDLLLLLLSPEEAAATALNSDLDGRRRRLLATVWAALGRGGTGLLAVAGVPRAAALRRRLLPLARRLALMDHPSRAHLLKVTNPSGLPSLRLPPPSSSFPY